MDYNLHMITVVELREYIRQAEKLLNDGERRELITYLASFPTAGALMRGTGGVRKLRWRRVGTGKSSGVRVIYYYHNETIPIFLLTMFGKSSKVNLSQAERNELAKLTKLIVKHYGSK